MNSALAAQLTCAMAAIFIRPDRPRRLESALTQETRPGGMAKLSLRPPLKLTRYIAHQNIAIHPKAAPAFEVYRSIRLSSRLPAILADPVLAVRAGRGQVLFIGNFASRFAFSDARSVPVLFVGGITDEEIQRISWAEVTRLAFDQLHPRTGFRDLKRVLNLAPIDVVDAVFGQTITDATLARHLAVDVSRFKEGRK